MNLINLLFLFQTVAQRHHKLLTLESVNDYVVPINSGIKRPQSRLTEALLLPDSVQSLHGAEILIYCVLFTLSVQYVMTE